MGRPINSKFFIRGGANAPVDVIKYQGVNVALNAAGTHYSLGATAQVSAPQDAAGTTATVTIAINSSTGVITTATINNVGSGYNTAPTVTINKPTSVTVPATEVSGNFTLTGITSTVGIYVGMAATAPTGVQTSSYVTTVSTNSVTLNLALNASTTTNVTFADAGSGATFTVGLNPVESDKGTIAANAYLSTGTSTMSASIINQESSRRYYVETAQGRGQCKLTATNTLIPGTMNIIATDYSGATYFVTKLTARKATLINRTSTGSALVSLAFDGTVTTGRTGWTTGSATGTIVTIATY